MLCFHSLLVPPHQAVYTRYGHESREVKLSPSAGGRDLGVETVGLSRTGVFVSRGGVEGVQVGDQILAVNGQSTGRYQRKVRV